MNISNGAWGRQWRCAGAGPAVVCGIVLEKEEMRVELGFSGSNKYYLFA